jgi:hypothetical protein
MPAGIGRLIGAAAEAVGRSLSKGGTPTDTVWAVAGLRAAADLLAAQDEDRAAPVVEGWVERGAARLGAGLTVAEAALAEHLGLTVPPPAGSAPGVIDTLLLAASAARHGADPSEWLTPLLAGAGPTWTGPAPDGSYDPLVAVGWWAAARSLLVDDRAGRLALFPAFPAAWRGHGVEVHGMPTAAGPASWALRWHGERPALLWEIGGEGSVTLTAPGLDRSWSTSSRAGEALLRS